MKKLFKFLKDEEGIELVEWALMAALFALAGGVAAGLMADDIATFFGNVGTYLSTLPVPGT